ncbi:MAG TPA: NUDIX hydrolase [Patescibacteria group bacterium]|nr:NUDIX hydrolase [Patescibacteria group bacterium]
MKIPSQAKLVFKGVIFDVYQWEQKMYDGSTAIFEAIKRTGTVQVIPTVGDKVLLSFEEQPGKPRQITFFGGRMEEGEKPLEAAKRELLEETGLQSDDWELFREYSSVGKIIWPMFFYIARNCHKVTQPHLDSGEKIEIKEFSFVEFVDIVSQENFADSHISNEVFRLKQDPQKLEEFRQKLFPR